MLICDMDMLDMDMLDMDMLDMGMGCCRQYPLVSAVQ
jgi:hypothetical protein